MRVAIALVVLAAVAHAGSIDKRVIRRTVKRHLPEISACFERHGDHAARVVVAFTIAPSGRVTSAIGLEEGNQGLRDCVAGVFRQMTFPAEAGRQPMHVRYPVHIIVANP